MNPPADSSHSQGRPHLALATLTSAMVVFRCDLLVLVGPLALQMLLAGEVHPHYPLRHDLPR